MRIPTPTDKQKRPLRDHGVQLREGLHEREPDAWGLAGNLPLLTLAELERVLTLAEAARMLSISIPTLRRRHGHLFVKLSPARRGLRMRSILMITGGLTAA